MLPGTENLSAVGTKIKAEGQGRRGTNVASLLLIVGVPAPPRSEFEAIIYMSERLEEWSDSVMRADKRGASA